MSRYIDTSYPIREAGGIEVNASLPCNASNFTAQHGRVIKYIVMHYTGNYADTAAANCLYFQGANRNASAHYFVDGSSIYQSVGAKDRAWAVGGTNAYKHRDCRNANSISIEMCCSAAYQVSDATEAHAAALCAELCKYVGIGADEVDAYVLRHWDVWSKDCPSGWTGANNARWIGFKAKVKALLEGDIDMDKINEISTQLAEVKAALSAQAAKHDSIIDKIGEEIDELKAASKHPMIYDYIDENLPGWARPTVLRLVGSGALKGDDKGRLGLTDEMLRMLVILDRCGVFG